jgi:uncharacterized protein with PIN domain
MSDLTEQPCTSCNGGMIEIPKMEMDSRGEPIVIMDIITCIVCHGNGKVYR